MENKLDGLITEFRGFCSESDCIEVETPESIDPKDVVEKNLNKKEGVEVIKSVSKYIGMYGGYREYIVTAECRWSFYDEMGSTIYFGFNISARVFIKTLPKTWRAPKEHRIYWYINISGGE